MNTKRMGSFIKELRKEKKLSRRDLSEKCYLESEKSVGDWENGNAIPDIDKLEILSKVFSVSIDELLDGERNEKNDFKDIYFKADKQKTLELRNDKSINYFRLMEEQDIRIIKRIDELLKIRIHDNFSNNEENEFAFLIDNFYEIDTEACSRFASMAIKDSQVLLRIAIRNCLSENQNMSETGKIWELKKFIKQKEDISFDLQCLRINGVPQKGSWADKRFNALNDLEKGMVLMSIQSVDPAIDEDKIGSRNLKRHEYLTGRKFDKDEESRLIIKYLIENGACLNTFYLNFYGIHHVKKRIIDRLEELYLMCKKPLDFYYGNGGKQDIIKLITLLKIDSLMTITFTLN